MTRLVYLAFPTGEISGGQKMILRHVETLCALGFDATCWIAPTNTLPTWFSHSAPIEQGNAFRSGDILILPDDAPNAIRTAAGLPQRSIIFCQNQFSLAGIGLQGLKSFPKDRVPDFMTVGSTAAATIRRLYPEAGLKIVPCFADERVFRPGALRQDAIVYSPRKRPLEARAIKALFQSYHPRHAHIPWIELAGAREAEVAQAFGQSTLHLSLSRLESIGMTPLEAMACGAVCAGFTGIGGRDFATPDNGFWVAEDDCEAAADALARAADLVMSCGEDLETMRAAGRDTAEQWSYAAFRVALEAAWMDWAPEARG